MTLHLDLARLQAARDPYEPPITSLPAVDDDEPDQWANWDQGDLARQDRNADREARW